MSVVTTWWWSSDLTAYVAAKRRSRRPLAADSSSVRCRPTIVSGEPWCVRRRSPDSGVIVEIEDEIAAAGRRWIGEANHLPWGVVSARSLPIDSMPDRQWVEFDAPDLPPTDDEWSAAPRAVDATDPSVDGGTTRPRPPGQAGTRRRSRRGGPSTGQRSSRTTHAPHPADTFLGRSGAPVGVHPVAARPRGAVRQVGPGVRRVGFRAVPSRGRGRAVLRAVRARARRWPRRWSPARSGSTCSRSTCRRWSASTSARPRRTSSASSTRPQPATSCCSSTRPTRCSASGPRSATRTTATPTSRSPYLLQRLEAYDGLVVLATNLRAQHRRRVPAADPVPRSSSRARAKRSGGRSGSAASRRRRRVLDDVDLDVLAEQFELSGGSSATPRCAPRSSPPPTTFRSPWRTLVRGVAREFQKMGRLLQPELFGRLYAMLDG